jgi:hypothetical protein
LNNKPRSIVPESLADVCVTRGRDLAATGDICISFHSTSKHPVLPTIQEIDIHRSRAAFEILALISRLLSLASSETKINSGKL